METLDNKEKYKCHDHDDLNYFGTRNIEHLFSNVDDNDYCKPILAKRSFNGNYKKQYLYKIIPYLNDLINEHKTIENNSNE